MKEAKTEKSFVDDFAGLIVSEMIFRQQKIINAHKNGLNNTIIDMLRLSRDILENVWFSINRSYNTYYSFDQWIDYSIETIMGSVFYTNYMDVENNGISCLNYQFAPQRKIKNIVHDQTMQIIDLMKQHKKDYLAYQKSQKPAFFDLRTKSIHENDNSDEKITKSEEKESSIIVNVEDDDVLWQNRFMDGYDELYDLDDEEKFSILINELMHEFHPAINMRNSDRIFETDVLISEEYLNQE